MVIFSGITVKIHQNHVYSHLIFQNFLGGPVGMPPDSQETLYFAIRSVTYSSRGVGTGPVGPVLAGPHFSNKRSIYSNRAFNVTL